MEKSGRRGVYRRVVCICAGFALATLVTSSAGAVEGDTIWTLAGTGVSGNTNDGGQATEAQIDQPRSIETTADGGYVWAQPWSYRVRKVGPDGRITTIAGTGTRGSSGDGGPATQAQLNFVHAASQMTDGGYVLADSQNSKIRRIWPNGTITTAAGTGTAGFSGDGGPATAAMIDNPRGVTALSDGGFLIPDSGNHRVRRVWPNGTITTVAGTGVQGFAGDDGQATSAQLSIPFAVEPTADGGFLVVDVGNQRIRKVSAAGIITTVAGNGTGGYSGDGGPATSASLQNPHDVAARPDGSFVIADSWNERVRLVSVDGTITTIAGTGVRGFSGDGGPAAAAQTAVPKGVHVGPSGEILVAEEQNNRIRFIGTPSAPANVALPVVSGTASENSTLSADAGGWSGTGPLISYQWQRCAPACADVAGATGKTYVLAAADVGARVRVLVTGSNSAGAATAASAETAVVSGAPVAPPVNTSPPTVSGSAQVGETLTASEGTWSGSQPLSYSYQWRRCNGSGGACVDIAGATAKTYLVASADVDSTLRVAVTASNGGSVYASAVSSNAPVSFWRFDEASGPLLDQEGFRDGSYVGAPTRAVPGLLTGDPNTAVSLSGSGQYLDVPADAAWTPSQFSLELIVRPSALPVNTTIWATAGVFAGWWLNTDSSGRLRMFVGDGGAWRFAAAAPVLNPGSTYHLLASYDGSNARLYVNGQLISTGPTVAIAASAGTLMRFGASNPAGQYWPGTIDEASFYPTALTASQVQAHYNASITGSLATSAATAVVAAAPVPPANTSPPSISGTAQEGATLTAAEGSWSGSQPLSYSYQWQRCTPACADIAGATAKTYLLAAADVGATMRVLVTAGNSAGQASATSPETAVVAAATAPPVNTSPPTVSGLARVGETLTAAEGSWSGSQPLSYSYQWRRCNGSGGACVDIAGATSKTYLVVNADLDATLRVAVTASNGASVYGSAVSGDAPVSFWRFDEASGPLLDRRGFRDGTYVGSPTRTVPGLLTGDPDTAVSLSGSGQYLEVPAAAAWTPSRFSLELVVRPSALPVNTTIWATTGTFTGWWLNTDSSGRLRMFVGDGGAWRFASANPVLSPGSVYHLLASYDGSNARLYVNGQLVSTGPTVAIAASPSSLMRFGASNPAAQYWPGTIDDASFYSTALTPAQVQAHYDASITGSLATSAATAPVTVAPANTAPPTISGSAQEGATLTADEGSWSGSQPLSYSYQWQRCTPACADIAAATAKTYLLAAADVGNTIRVLVSAGNSAGQATAASAETATVTALIVAPANTSPPTISGTAQEGATLTADEGSWSGSQPLSYSYQWQRCTPACADIAGATAKTYVLAAADVGATIRVLVSAGNSAGQATAASAETATVTALIVAPANTSPPTISGTAQEGATLTANDGTWSGTSPSFSYQWQRCAPGCVDVAGATGKTYVPAAADVGTTMRVLVTASNSAGAATAASAETTVVSAAATVAPTNTSPPTVSGLARVGETLTANEGTWSGSQPMSFSYQWRRCNGSGGACVDIAGATAKTYLVASADLNSTLRVAVTASNGASAYGSAVSGDAPVSFWRFDEASGPLLDRQRFRDGTYVGAPTRTAPGLLQGDPNPAVSLSGSGQYLEVPAAPAWTPSRFSIEIVVRPSALPVNTTIWATAGVFAGWWLNTDSSGRLRMFVGDGRAWRFAAAAPVLNPGTTYHLLASFNGNNARLYVNGKLISTGPHVTMTASPTTLMRFGASNPAGQYWPGTIDEASFYASALSPSQVQAHYNASITGSLATSAATAVVGA